MYEGLLVHKPNINTNCKEHNCIFLYKLMDVLTLLYGSKFRSNITISISNTEAQVVIVLNSVNEYDVLEELGKKLNGRK